MRLTGGLGAVLLYGVHAGSAAQVEGSARSPGMPPAGAPVRRQLSASSLPPSPPPADALASGNIDAAAQLIAGALPGNALAINTAATLAPAEGLTTQLAQAASLAVTKYGADATAVAAALSEVGGPTGSQTHMNRIRDSGRCKTTCASRTHKRMLATRQHLPPLTIIGAPLG